MRYRVYKVLLETPMVSLPLVRFPDPLGKWVGRTNPLRAGIFLQKLLALKMLIAPPIHVTLNWILQHVDKGWTLSKRG